MLQPPTQQPRRKPKLRLSSSRLLLRDDDAGGDADVGAPWHLSNERDGDDDDDRVHRQPLADECVANGGGGGADCAGADAGVATVAGAADVGAVGGWNL